jgi:hypothetical protein
MGDPPSTVGINPIGYPSTLRNRRPNARNGDCEPFAPSRLAGHLVSVESVPVLWENLPVLRPRLDQHASRFIAHGFPSAAPLVAMTFLYQCAESFKVRF